MKLFVKFGHLKPDASSTHIQNINDRFMTWLRNIRATGNFAMSGGFEDSNSGMTIIEAKSKKEAFMLFSEDPFNELLASWEMVSWNTLDV